MLAIYGDAGSEVLTAVVMKSSAYRLVVRYKSTDVQEKYISSILRIEEKAKPHLPYISQFCCILNVFLIQFVLIFLPHQA
jgi:hypothetical protein